MFKKIVAAALAAVVLGLAPQQSEAAQFQQIRNATAKLHYGGKTFLIDPWLAPKGATGSYVTMYPDIHIPDRAKESIRMPMCDLPMPAEKILQGVDTYLLTHLHFDHFDLDKYNKVLDRKTPIYVQNEEELSYMQKQGFKKAGLLKDEGMNWGAVKVTRIDGLHGSIKACGPSSGLLFEAEGEPTIYFAGDTVWYEGVKETLAKYKPEVIVLNAADAQLDEYGHLIMDDAGVQAVYEACPKAKIVISHMDNIAHAYLTRTTMHQKLAKRGIDDKVLIPDDGQVYDFVTEKGAKK